MPSRGDSCNFTTNAYAKHRSSKQASYFLSISRQSLWIWINRKGLICQQTKSWSQGQTDQIAILAWNIIRCPRTKMAFQIQYRSAEPRQHRLQTGTLVLSVSQMLARKRKESSLLKHEDSKVNVAECTRWDTENKRTHLAPTAVNSIGAHQPCEAQNWHVYDKDFEEMTNAGKDRNAKSIPWQVRTRVK